MEAESQLEELNISSPKSPAENGNTSFPEGQPEKHDRAFPESHPEKLKTSSFPNSQTERQNSSYAGSYISNSPRAPSMRGSCHLGCLSGTGLERSLQDDLPCWDYTSNEHGQHKWADLHPNWKVAKEGVLQSPINICCNDTVKPDKYLGPLKVKFNSAPATIENNGHTIQVNWRGGHMKIDNVEYNMVQFHFHSPSEHTINGIRYPLEMHIVMTSADDRVAVVGILFREGAENKFLSQFWSHLPPLTTLNEKRYIGELNVDHLQLKNAFYYRYVGSLTTPPCTEGVTWTIMQKVHQASPQQLKMFKNVIESENARQVQELKGRVVQHRKTMISTMLHR
eukprot:TRINITY_DN397_c0_g2_i2.p1 TRINITY_DN397_c0_g2~~TRINITY_DN397_c0_g2_i2.p1  ORF type:complete len:338 (-),score=60.52 TRINITY_DN397_c0_g2_i2:231-1244(-)